MKRSRSRRADGSAFSIITRLQLVWQQNTVTVPSRRPDSRKPASMAEVNSSVDFPGAETCSCLVKVGMGGVVQLKSKSCQSPRSALILSFFSFLIGMNTPKCSRRIIWINELTSAPSSLQAHHPSGYGRACSGDRGFLCAARRTRPPIQRPRSCCVTPTSFRQL